jgi:hypothetical protein
MEISPIGAVSAGRQAMASSPVSASPAFKIGMPGENMPVHMPEGIEVRQAILRDFGIQVLDSDVRFSKAELLVVEEVLKDIKKKKHRHLIGVKEIVKNKSIKVSLLKGALVHAGGGYVAEQKRVYIFDDLPPEMIPEVLVHEIGHAVNHFNLSFERFMEFIKENGWNMQEMRSVFFNDNKLYQFGIRKIDVPENKWGNLWDRFSMNSLAKEQDVFGEVILQLPGKSKDPWDKNPLEKFAWAYEWYYNKRDAFKQIADRSFEETGDQTLEKTYEFMEKEVFGG